MVRLGYISMAIILVSSILLPGCAGEQEPLIEDPKDRIVEILQLTDEQVEQLEAGTGTLQLREDQVDILSAYVAQLLDDLEPWVDEEQWQEVNGILETMLTQGEIDSQTLGPVAEAITDCLTAMTEVSTSTYTNFGKLSTESAAPITEQSLLSEGSQPSTLVTLYTPKDSTAGDEHFDSGVVREYEAGGGNECVGAANAWSGALAVYSDALVIGGAETSALHRIIIHVPVDNTDLTIRAPLDYISDAVTVFYPAPVNFASTAIRTAGPFIFEPFRDVTYKVIDPWFDWEDGAQCILEIIGLLTGGVIDKLADAVSALWDLKDAVAYYLALQEESQQEIVTYNAESLSAGDYYFEVGVRARAHATFGRASAFVFGMIPEIEVTLNIPTFTLTTVSTDGGQVTQPGEGTFTRWAGEEVALVAEASEDYQFINWTGDVDTIADVNDATTTITMDGDYSIVANFEEEGEEPVYFPDSNLEAAIREAIGKPTGDIYPSDLAGLTSLDASERNIADLTGLEYCTNLSWLSLYDNLISDLSPIANLSSLTYLSLSSNQISYIVPVGNLTNLTYLNLSNNQVNDIMTVADLTNLTYLNLWDNQVSNISPLVNLVSLTELLLGENEIGDVSPLANLNNLTYLDLWDNHVNNISPLTNLNNLTTLYIGANQIYDIGAIANLTNLTALDLRINTIYNILPLANLTKLIALYLEFNYVSDISALADLANLSWVDLKYNQIIDISPLVNNSGLGEGDHIYLTNNPLSDTSINVYIPELEARGVYVDY